MQNLAERKLLLVKQIHHLERQLNELKWQSYWWSELPPLEATTVDALATTYVIARPNSKG